jgi:hypothetical protein
VRLLFFLSFLLFSSSSFALSCTGGQAISWLPCNQQNEFCSASQSCITVAPDWVSKNGSFSSCTTVTAGNGQTYQTCNCSEHDSNGTYWVVGGIHEECRCPTGTTRNSDGSCSTPFCPSGETFDSALGYCHPDCASTKGNIVGTKGTVVGSSNTAYVPGNTTMCFSHCSVSFDTCGGNPNVLGFACLGPGVSTGKPCSTNSQPIATSPTDAQKESECFAKGQGFGYVNGVGACSGPFSSTTSKTSTSTSNTNSSGTTTSSSTSTTTCDGANCTTTTTNSDGTSSQKTQDQSSFCQSNPNNPACVTDFCDKHSDLQICKSSTVSGGDTCDSEPTCDGDAAQCAAVSQAWHIRCDSEVSAKGESSTSTGQAIIDGQDPQASSYPDPNNPTPVRLGDLDSSEPFAASCPAAISFSVQGHQISIDFTPVCELGSIIGVFNLIFASIGALYILSRS